MNSRFDIKKPHTLQNMRIYFNSNDNKIELLQKLLLNRKDKILNMTYEDYCNNKWLWDENDKKPFLSYEDKTKFFLNRCADFLLLGEYNKSNVLTPYKNKLINDNEISYSGDPRDDKTEILLEQQVNKINSVLKNDLKPYTKSNIKNYYNQYKPQSSKRRFDKKTKINKIHNIYHKPSKIKRKYYKLTNKEVYDRNNIQYPKFDTEEELKKWQKRKYKNICGECVWDYKNVKIKGHKGLIDKNKPYKVKWCSVNTDNEFMFDNNKYKISDKVEQYGLKNDIYIMDKVLVYEQYGNKYFFDQEIERIDNKFIKKL